MNLMEFIALFPFFLKGLIDILVIIVIIGTAITLWFLNKDNNVT